MLTWGDGLRRLVRRPHALYNRLRVIVWSGHFRNERERWLSRLTGASDADVRGFISEIECDRAFVASMRNAFRRHTAYLPLPTDFMVEPTGGGSMFFHLVTLYALLRIVRPRTVVETGGTPGKSSAFILRALDRNEEGELHTIDLPPKSVGSRSIEPSQITEALPEGLGTGWCVPDGLRSRHHVLLGPAQEHLPRLLRRLGCVDVFIHDSDHSYSHMQWEFRMAFPFLRTGGYLWSDDILGNAAWDDFCREAGLDGRRFLSQGVVRKP